MAVTARTWTTNELVSAAMMNTIRDDLLYLEGQGIGEETVYLPAAALLAEAGAAPGSLEVLDFGTIVHYGIPFDPDSDEMLDFGMVMPKRYDAGSVYMAIEWTTASGGGAAGNVVWQAEGNKLDDGDALGTDPSSGGGTVTDTWQADGDWHLTSWFEVTLEGSVSGANVKAECRVGRAATNGSDTMTGDAYLLGVSFRWTSDQETDD